MSVSALPLAAQMRQRIRPPASAFVALAIFAVFALAVPRFATPGNVENVLRVASILCIVSCGQAIVLILGGIEFSFGASVALASIATVLALPDHGTLSGFAAGAAVVIAVGALNGLLIARFELPPFLATLGSMMVTSGLASTIAGSLPIEAPPSAAFSWPAHGRLAGIPVPVLAAALSVGLLHLLLARSRIGRQWYLAGANVTAARQAGVPVGRTVFAGYLVAGMFCALAAVILTSRVASGQPNLAPNLPFETIAACAVGGIPLAGGRGRAAQVVAGVLIIAMINNALVLLNLPVAYQQLMAAVFIVGAALIARASGRSAALAALFVRRRP